MRSAASRARALPRATSTSAGTSWRHSPSAVSVSTSATPVWAIVSTTRSSPKTTPGAFWTIRAVAGRRGGDRRLAGDVAVAEVLGQRPGDQLAHLFGGNCGHRMTLAGREGGESHVGET